MRSAPLDGIRALAVVAVLGYHGHYAWAQGGYLGVDVFFVLSGYLITGVLLSTHRSWWGYRQFLVRRAVRLMPALVVAMVGATVVALATGLDAPVLGCGGVSIGYLMNLPFTRSLHCPDLWHVTWSLAAEQQFYLVWPLVLGAAWWASRAVRPLARRLGPGSSARARHRLLRLAGLVTALLWVLSLGHQWQLLDAGVRVSRIEFAPDGRSLALLVGCALALLVRPSGRAPTGGGLPADISAGIAFGVLVVCFVKGDLGDGPEVLGPIVLAALAGTVLVRSAVTPGPVTAAVLGARPVAWLGRVSYSLYLWHEIGYRIAEQTAPRDTLTLDLLRVLLALGLAAASYHWVEQPVQRWWSARGADRRAEEKVLVSATS